jgi:heme/copper-type cytochrome/quinol oxidase subunit 4
MPPYLRFALMILTSVVVMYGLTYLNTYALDHIYFSETRLYMAIMMGASMAVIMLLYMLHMYKNRAANMAIIAGALIVFAGSIYLVRSQVLVDQVSYMRAMIPHHSIAILTSRRATITDPRVRELADGIIKAQVKEIAEMKALIAKLEDKNTKQ